MARVEAGASRFDAESLRSGPSDGLGLVVVVTGRANSPIVGETRHSATHDDTIVVICAAEVPPSGGFNVDGTSPSALDASWTTLVHGGR
jgi:hypothetical protein